MTKACAFAMYNCILLRLGEKLRLGRRVREKVSSMHDRDMMKRNIDSAAVMIFQPLFCKLGKSQHFTKFSLCLCLSFDKRERKSCIKFFLGEFALIFRDDTLWKRQYSVFRRIRSAAKISVLFPFIVLPERVFFFRPYILLDLWSHVFFFVFCCFSF